MSGEEMKHKSLLVYVPCLEGGCKDIGRVELDGHTLVSDERLWDLEAAEKATDEIESLQRYRTAYNEWIDKTEWMQEGMPAKYLGMHRADILKDMISELLDRLEAAEKERDAAELMSLALRAKIEQMEKQEPIATLHDDGYFTWVASRPYESGFAGWRMKVYALPGAKGEEK